MVVNTDTNFEYRLFIRRFRPAQLSHFAKQVCVEVAYARVRTASGSDRIMPTAFALTTIHLLEVPTAFALTTIHLLEVTLYDPVATVRGSDTKLQAKAR